jgi:anti-sigma regulatory factor (Ser/Thr protein kinase)
MTALAMCLGVEEPTGKHVHRGLRIRPDAVELPRARALADESAEHYGLDERERYDFTLAASEAVANAIEHGRACWDGTIHLWTSEGERGLTFGVRNAGEFVLKPTSTDPLADRGRGLTMISQLVDVASLTRMGDHVVMELLKRRAGDEEESLLPSASA